ncbi:MAG: GTP 3',8-cyclase MoaA [Bacteroidota bacterium]
MESQQLIDKFGRKHTYLRISLTDACNLRCVYCMPNEKVLVTPSAKLMQVDEIDFIARTFVDLGITKIRLTGGEPLLRKDAKQIIQNLAKLNVELSISTNAILVNQYIDVFKEAGIKSLNISLDTLSPQEFFTMTKRAYFDKIMSNIELLLSEGFHLKINIVVLKNHNENAILDFIEWTRKTPLEVRFIEFMPFQGNSWKNEDVISFKDILKTISEKYIFERIGDSPNDTAKHYQVPGFLGKFAFITTITEPFCDSCNRLRLTADGKMKNCLFSTGEMDILSAFRVGKDIKSLIQENVSSKKKERGGRFDSLSEILDENRSMIKIGG